jgi:TetR/AcrR family transcriptional regulator, regulator of cefoperazone and chloramphenicol sensitivity
MREDRETRERLLKAAEAMFADRGFKRVTVREICRAARANIAAVNYYFGDKLGLYRNVLQAATESMRNLTEEARAAGAGQPPDEKLRRYLRIFLHRLLAPDHEAMYRLVQREIQDPTPVLDEVVEHGVRPRLLYLSEIVADIIGCDVSDPRVLPCAASIQAQAVSYVPNPIVQRLGLRFDPTPANIDAVVRHIARFSLAGVRAVGCAARPGALRAPARQAPSMAMRVAKRPRRASKGR